eukprot:681270-Amphidinium_carterae.1
MAIPPSLASKFGPNIAPYFYSFTGGGLTLSERYRANTSALQDVIVYARAQSSAKATGVYGYGIMSNSFMGGYKDRSFILLAE